MRSLLNANYIAITYFRFASLVAGEGGIFVLQDSSVVRTC